tara:strand:- start:4103 stop:4399 length:297 start_codon:yes stop_codon:yes gene_type:complete
MQNNIENTKQTPICKHNEALISLLTNYAKEDVNFAFTEFETIFNEWLESEYADNTVKRCSALYSLAILKELGTIIQGISPKKIKKLYQQMQSTKNQMA